MDGESDVHAGVGLSMVSDRESDAEMEPSGPMRAADVAGLHGRVHGGVYIAADDGEHDYDDFD